MFFYPDDEQEQVASTALTDAQQQKPIVEKGEGTDSARLNPTRPISVEDISDEDSNQFCEIKFITTNLS